MQESRKNLLKSIYRVCFSILTVVVGLLFIAQAWSIFRSAEHGAYTVASISEHFYQIAVPVVCWGLALIVNIFLGGGQEEKVKPYFEGKERLARLEKRLPYDSKLRAFQKSDALSVVVGTIALAFAWGAVAISVSYLFAKDYSPVLSEEIFAENKGMADRLVRVLLWSGSAIMLLAAAVILDEYLAKRKEMKIKREIAKNAATKKPVVVLPEEKERKSSVKDSSARLWITRGVVAAVGIVCLVSGLTNGGVQSVLEKAVRICTQCIGLG